MKHMIGYEVIPEESPENIQPIKPRADPPYIKTILLELPDWKKEGY